MGQPVNGSAGARGERGPHAAGAVARLLVPGRGADRGHERHRRVFPPPGPPQPAGERERGRAVPARAGPVPAEQRRGGDGPDGGSQRVGANAGGLPVRLPHEPLGLRVPLVGVGPVHGRGDDGLPAGRAEFEERRAGDGVLERVGRLRGRVGGDVEVVRVRGALPAADHRGTGEQVRGGPARLGAVQIDIDQPAGGGAEPDADVGAVGEQGVNGVV
ncbi:hypothetical protein FTUN_5761 [Frigoriglobus tundricola]|uniref:Uncharacterized protein n=1 Tax=Frigoriglobus tundricola TaxID=2774151 RepID=A0A6M5YY63_9BACT|nr:hypothetical protein FTUN_5761 [Frigoriglobus tundricola]